MDRAPTGVPSDQRDTARAVPADAADSRAGGASGAVRVVAGVEALRALAGQQLGTSDWLLVDQARIDAFARVTEDEQWIHVDVERAAAGPFGATVAHGHLTASLIPRLVRGAYRFEGAASIVNYGSDKVRFPAPVPAGSRIRAHVELLDVTDVPGGVQARFRVTVEREGGERPVCVAETVSRILLPLPKEPA